MNTYARQIPPSNFSSPNLLFSRPQVSCAAEVFSAYAGLPEATLYMSWKTKKSVGEVEDFLRRVLLDWESGEGFTWICANSSDGKIVGCASFRPARTGYEIGYVLSPLVWGRGLGTELVTAMIELAFQDNAVQRVWAYCDCENKASIRVLEKAGMELEGKLRKWGQSPNLSTTALKTKSQSKKSSTTTARDQFCYAKVRD